MMRSLSCLLLPMLLVAAEPAVVPRPQSMTPREGRFRVAPGLPARAPETFRGVLEGFCDAFPRGQFAPGAAGEGLELVLDPAQPREGYQLEVGPRGLRLAAADAAGAFHGLQTLRQMLPDLEQARGVAVLEGLRIQDAPRFTWRGLHLDVSRHFFTVGDIKGLLDAMARLKLNVFHWHLTDTGGWRLEIQKYPRLTQVGAWRRPVAPWDQSRMDFPGTGPQGLYGGFYTQAEAREIVRYAAERHITVVPEIELPGHQIPVFFAYPELGCEGVAAKPGQVWRHDVFCVGQESTFRFLEEVLQEVLDIFPSPVIHIGGDEVDKTAWKGCPRCQARMKVEGLKDAEALQSWTIRRMERFLAGKGRALMGWDEILEGGLAPNAMVMSWRGEDGGIAAARAGHPVVMAPGGFLYLDQPERARPMEKVYSYNPVPAALTTEQARWIQGAEACLWTEWMPDLKTLQDYLWPRLGAVAEVCWTQPARKDWAEFQRRLPGLYTWLQRRGTSFHVEPPAAQASLVTLGGPVAFAPSTIPGFQVRYTLDGSEPTATSPVFTAPLRPTQACQVKARLQGPEGPVGTVTEVQVKALPTGAEPTRPGLVLAVRRGNFDRTSGFEAVAPVETRVVGAPAIAPFLDGRTFGLHWTGYFKVEREGLYTFSLDSDDGSRLSLHGTTVVDNDGCHSAALRRGGAWLRPGYHPLDLRFFEGGGGCSFRVQVEGPGLPLQDLPADRLFH